MLAVLIRSRYLIVNISTVSATLAACCLHWEFVNTELRIRTASSLMSNCRRKTCVLLIIK